MAISQLPQAPYRQDRKVFITPLVSDVLFSEVRDCNRAAIPDYGTPHPNSSKWPNHKLVFVKPVDIERNEIFEFFYAADRENQDLYNFQYSQGDLVLTRTYIIPRDSLEDFQEPAIGTVDSQFPDYRFASQRVQRVEDKELDSLYVAVQRVYSIKGTIIAADSETKTGFRINRTTTIGNLALTGGNTSSRYDEKGWTNQTESVTITGGKTITTVDQKPFVKIQSDTVVSSASSVPSTGTGSSRLVYDNGTTKVYENVTDTSSARTGSAGVEKEARPYANITTTKSYSTDNNVTTPTGSAQVIFNDGKTVVYEKSLVTAVAKTGDAGQEKEKRPYAELTTNKKYATTGNVNTNLGSSNVVWTDGQTSIYEVNEITAKAKKGNAGQEKEKRPYDELTTNKKYDTTGNVRTDLGSSNVVWTDGQTSIYEVNEITAKPLTNNKPGDEQQHSLFGTVKTVKTYVRNPELASGEIGATNVVWTDGATTIYEKSVASFLSVNRTEYTSAYSKDDTAAVERVNTKFSEKPTDSREDNYTSKLVYSDGKKYVYEIQETKIEPNNKEWDELVNYEWPSVLTNFWVETVESKNTAGLFYYFPRMLFKQGFTGPQRAKVKQWWQKSKPVIPKPIIMVPSGTTFRSTFYDFTLPPCLHPKMTLGGTIGSRNPEYKVALDQMVLPATNFTDWPKEVSWTETKLYKGGFLCTQTTIESPDVKYQATQK